MVDQSNAQDVVDQAEMFIVLDEAVWILESTWRVITAAFPADFQRELLEAFPRQGHFIVIPRITWILVSYAQAAQS